MNNKQEYLRRVNEGHELLLKLALYIFSPFIAFVVSLRDAASRSSYVIYFLFAIIFAWHMNTIPGDRYDDLEGVTDYIRSNNISTKDMGAKLTSYFTLADDAPKELYMDILIWFSQLFSNNPHLVFAIAAIPWSCFFLASLKEITNDSNFQNGSFICLIILLLFVAPRDVITLQNPRNTTGLWIVIYSCIKYFKDHRNNKKYLLLLLLTPLVHAGFWPFVLIMPLALIVTGYYKISMLLFTLSIPFSTLAYGLLTDVDYTSSILPPAISRSIEGYLSDDSYAKHVLKEGGTGFSWVTKMFNVFIQYAYILLPMILWRENKLSSGAISKHKFINFYIFLFAFVNFIQFIPVLGDRYSWIVHIFSIYVYFKWLYPKYKWWIWVCLFARSFALFKRFFYEGAVSSSVPLEIFYAPAPYLIWDFWGAQ